MNTRQIKKIVIQIKQKQIQELELILSTHWERQITDKEAKEALKEKLFGFGKENARIMPQLESIVDQNKFNNNRYLKRRKLFSAKALAKKLIMEAEKSAK